MSIFKRDRSVDRFCRWLCERFPRRYRLIPQADGSEPLLHQFAIIKDNGWFGVFLHRFENPEPVQFFHHHRWKFMLSFVLSGWFFEERAVPAAHRRGETIIRYPKGEEYVDWAFSFVVHDSPSVYWMNSSVIHRIHTWPQHCWTLCFVFRNRERWGYYDRLCDMRYIPWEDHVKVRVPSIGQ
jgi:hypothetical protein